MLETVNFDIIQVELRAKHKDARTGESSRDLRILSKNQITDAKFRNTGNKNYSDTQVDIKLCCLSLIEYNLHIN